MSKFCLSCLLCAALFIVPCTIFVSRNDTIVLERERRKAASFPVLAKKPKVREFRKFSREFGAFYADHFPFRNELIDIYAPLIQYLGDNLDTDVCYSGKDGWLFLGNNSAHCVDKLQGTISLGGKKLSDLTTRYLNMEKFVKERGASFSIFIGPNKSTCYPEFLPDVLSPSKDRYISPLVQNLENKNISIFDATNSIKKEKQNNILYYRTDTHWNALGAFIAFKGFAQHQQFPSVPLFSFKEGDVYKGDLIEYGGYTSYPLHTGDNFIIENSESIKNTPPLIDKNIWVFGDSFLNALKPYFTASYKEAHFFHHSQFESALKEAAQMPDAVVWVIVERNFTESFYVNL